MGNSIRDIKGQRFGRLVARYPTEGRERKGSVLWNCQCDCGNETVISVSSLVHGLNLSCGCLKRENQKTIFEKLHRVDGTCVEWLERRKERNDNTSGFRGVYKMKNGKYRVNIGFKGQRYYLGVFRDYDMAVQSRLKAEQVIHDGFLQAYYQWRQRADADPEWARQNKFTYNIEKSGDEWIVTQRKGEKDE